MDLSTIRSKLSNLNRKYRYALIVLLIGIILMILPSKTSQSKQNESLAPSVPQDITIEQRLSAMLTRVSGAGEVHVMLTVSSGEETLYQVDTDRTDQEGQQKNKTSTITITDSQRNESGLVRQVNPPSYLGAIIVCQGADDPSVRLAIVEAVSKATGLGADKISVLKMK